MIVARYVPHRGFPPYAYLPGRDPHPVRDPRGHSHGITVEAPPYRPAAEWRDNQTYLFGVDLYNHGYLWEAHEAWEDVWHPSKGDPVQAQFLQGLIQCSAACLKIAMEQPAGLEKLAALGTGRLEDVARAAGARFMGLALPEFVASFRAFAAGAPSSADARPRIELA